jgi:predicted lactoylglutathione lyase
MRASISFVSLLVRDVAISRGFYEALGLVASDRSRDDFALFQMNGVVLAIATRKAIAKELGFPLGKGGGVLLSHNVESAGAVAETLETARRAGASILRKAAPASWGGLIGCFADPDGHVWEVVFNPGLPMDASGNALLDPPGVW